MLAIRFLTSGAFICAAAPLQAAQNVPVRTLAPATAATTSRLRMVFAGVRAVGDGKIMINEASVHRLLLFDSTLASFTVLRDSVAGTANGYGSRVAYVIPYLGDSSLFLDYASQSLLLLDPRGEFVRIMALPNANDLGLLTRGRGAQIDAKGRLVYLGGQSSSTTPPEGPQAKRVTQEADSAPLLRASFETRRVDTVAWVRTIARPVSVRTEGGGKTLIQQVTNPLQTLDGWTTVADGSIALVRGHDYHIDWINADGSTGSSPKMPFDWRRLTDADKQHLVDSVRAVADSATAASNAKRGGRPAECISVQAGRDVAGACTTTIQTSFVPAKDIPDYYPPLRLDAVRADADGNVWIIPTTTSQSISGELVYDVVNRRGELFERVRVPAGRTIAGFGRGGLVYLMYRPNQDGLIIERTRVAN